MLRVPTKIEKYRDSSTPPWISEPGDHFGRFEIHGPTGLVLRVIAYAAGSGPDADWDHVSVSTRYRCPTWEEMCFIKDLFWEPTDVVMQLHPAKSNYINLHPYVLHLWRPVAAVIPLPPLIAV